jgi:hypothetical protein
MLAKAASPADPSAPVPVASTFQITPSGREALKLYELEIATYLRELSRLLADGHAGRHVLVKGGEIVGVWDTQGDAIQAGRERFGIEPIFVKTIDQRDPERFALLNTPKESSCPS